MVWPGGLEGIPGNPKYVAQNDPHDTLITLSHKSWRKILKTFSSGPLCGLNSKPLPVLRLPFYQGTVM